MANDFLARVTIEEHEHEKAEAIVGSLELGYGFEEWELWEFGQEAPPVLQSTCIVRNNEYDDADLLAGQIVEDIFEANGKTRCKVHLALASLDEIEFEQYGSALVSADENEDEIADGNTFLPQHGA